MRNPVFQNVLVVKYKEISSMKVDASVLQVKK